MVENHVPTLLNVFLIPVHTFEKNPVTVSHIFLIPFHAFVKKSFTFSHASLNMSWIFFPIPLKNPVTADHMSLIFFHAFSASSLILSHSALKSSLIGSSTFSLNQSPAFPHASFILSQTNSATSLMSSQFLIKSTIAAITRPMAITASPAGLVIAANAVFMVSPRPSILGITPAITVDTFSANFTILNAAKKLVRIIVMFCTAFLCLFIQFDSLVSALASLSSILTATPPVHSAIGLNKLSHAQIHNGFNASRVLFRTSNAPDRTSRNAGSASSMVHFARGTRISS